MLNSIVVSSSTGYFLWNSCWEMNDFQQSENEEFFLDIHVIFIFLYVLTIYQNSISILFCQNNAFLPWKNGFDMILQLLCLTIVLFGDSIKPLKFSLFCQFLVNFNLSVISGQIRHFSGIFYSFCLCHQFEENTRYGNRAKINFKDLGP